MNPAILTDGALVAAEAHNVASLAERRLLKRLCAGEPAAFAALWADWRDAAWTACRAMEPERDRAVALLARIYRELPQSVRGWDHRHAVCCLFGAHVFATLRDALQLPAPVGIEVDVPPTLRAPTDLEVRTRLSALDPTVRLVYVADLLFGCSAATLAELLTVDEQQLRAARSVAAFAVVSGGPA
jgi:hypothetical protein